MADERPAELPAVAALRVLSIFGADQGGAYREHFDAVARALGDDVPTKLAAHARQWAAASEAGALILTGNAGTGKTAVAEAYCHAAGGALPTEDGPVEVAGRLVIKDLSGLPGPSDREQAVRRALENARAGRQAMVCANEGVLRDAGDVLGEAGEPLLALLDRALREGAAREGDVVVVNVNRQRPTAEALWDRLVDLLAREELWEPGCKDCPGDGQGPAGCPMRANAAALRGVAPRAALRELVQLGAGEAVPTMREVLSILGWAIVGGATCQEVKNDARDRGHTAEDAYFHRALGGGLRPDVAARSPLLQGMRASGLGDTSDLQVDEWLRDSSGAPRDVQQLAGAPEAGAQPSADPLEGSRSPHDRVRTGAGLMTFHALGETLSTSEDLAKVQACHNALVGAEGEAPRQALWRRRVYFEAPEAVGGRRAACARLLDVRYLGDFLALAEEVAAGGAAVLALSELVRGLRKRPSIR